MQVILRHSISGSLKFVDVGWSWSLFLGASFLGLPLFFRGLPLWGTLMLVLWVLQIFIPIAGVGGADDIEPLLNLAVFGLCLYLGFKGNAETAKHFVSCGYELAKPDSIEARVARERLGI